MKKYTIALVALSGLGVINNAKGYDAAKQTVTFSNELNVPVFFGINGSTGPKFPVMPNQTSKQSYTGIVTEVILHTPPLIPFTGSKIKGNTWYWNWNTNAAKVRFMTKHIQIASQGFPGGVGNITISRVGGTMAFLFSSSSTYPFPPYSKIPVEIDCATGGGTFMVGECPGGG